MGGNDLQFEQQLRWDGVVGIDVALVIAILLALVAAWALWRERAAVGRGWAAAFFVMRLVAFGFALWMLAGPTLVRVERSSTNQTIAVFADNSESMEIVDTCR
jgi:hypothetical protein